MNASLSRALAALRLARLSGALSACLFVLMAGMVLDGLQALMRDDFNRIDLPQGGKTLVSGAMPLQAKTYTDIFSDIEGLDGLSFTPLADFRGFWLGAHMWRASLEADASTAPGRAVLTIVDLVPAKSTTGNATIMVQNPNQIYVVTVWPSETAMQAAHYSLSRRLTGQSAFIWAAVCFFCGIGVAGRHYFHNQAAHRALAAEGVFVIHGIRKTDAGYNAICAMSANAGLPAGLPMLLLTPDGTVQGKGLLQECPPLSVVALFPLDGTPPRYGWLLRQGADVEQDRT